MGFEIYHGDITPTNIANASQRFRRIRLRVIWREVKMTERRYRVYYRVAAERYGSSNWIISLLLADLFYKFPAIDK